MKPYAFSLTILATAILATACLDEYPKGQLTASEAYASAADIERNCVGDLYNHIGGSSESQGLQGTYRGVYDWNSMTTDEQMLPIRGGDWQDGGFWNRLYNHTWTASDNELTNTWNYLYKVIALCNRSLHILDQHSSLLSKAQHQRYQAEVRAIRALFYFHTLDLFGRIPLITLHGTSPDSVKQSERSEVYRFVVDELQSIAPLLAAERSNTPGNHYGRMTRPVAYFLLAKLAINAEVYSDDDWTDGLRPNGANTYFRVDGKLLNAWQTTIAYCDSLASASPVYSLESDYAANFKVYNETSLENIFTIPMSNTLYANRFLYLFRSLHYAHGGAIGTDAENGTCATRTAMQAYGILHDNPQERTTQPDKRFHTNFHADTVRVEGTIVTDGYGNPLVYHPLQVAEDLTGTPYEKTGGARMAKYETDRTAYDDGKLQNNDIVLFRYADALLMKAEAKVRNGESGQQEMDAVRLRSGMASREATLENLLTERLLELMWEGWRRNDLVRFGKFTEAYDNRPNAVSDTNGYTTVFPIPDDVLSLNPRLRQNPGYASSGANAIR